MTVRLASAYAILMGELDAISSEQRTKLNELNIFVSCKLRDRFMNRDAFSLHFFSLYAAFLYVLI